MLGTKKKSEDLDIMWTGRAIITVVIRYLIPLRHAVGRLGMHKKVKIGLIFSEKFAWWSSKLQWIFGIFTGDDSMFYLSFIMIHADTFYTNMCFKNSYIELWPLFYWEDQNSA